jgi:hypothetical protein
MAFRKTYSYDDGYGDEPVREPVVSDEAYEERVDERPVATAMRPWSPAQIISMIIGIGFVVLGIAAVARTGFNTDDVYNPRYLVWHLPHNPVLAVSEIAFGALLIIAAVVPGGARWLMGLLGAIALVFGLLVLVDAAQTDMNHWLAVEHSNGWLFTIVGAVLILTAWLSPVFVPGYGRRHDYRRVHTVH